jgi:hypothetical protein
MPRRLDVDRIGCGPVMCCATFGNRSRNLRPESMPPSALVRGEEFSTPRSIRIIEPSVRPRPFFGSVESGATALGALVPVKAVPMLPAGSGFRSLQGRTGCFAPNSGFLFNAPQWPAQSAGAMPAACHRSRRCSRQGRSLSCPIPVRQFPGVSNWPVLSIPRVHCCLLRDQLVMTDQ